MALLGFSASSSLTMELLASTKISSEASVEGISTFKLIYMVFGKLSFFEAVGQKASVS